MGTRCARFDFAWPPSHGSHSNPSFVQITLVALERAIAVKKIRLVSAFLVGPVVRGKDYQGVFINIQFFQQIQNSAHILIHVFHHCRKGGNRIGDHRTAVLPGDFFKFRKLFPPWGDTLFGGLHGGMRNGEGNITKERIIFIFPNEFQTFIRNQAMGIMLAIQHNFLSVTPNMGRIKVVRLSLAIETIKTIKSLVHGIPLRPRCSQTPFTKHAGDIP